MPGMPLASNIINLSNGSFSDVVAMIEPNVRKGWLAEIEQSPDQLCTDHLINYY